MTERVWVWPLVIEFPAPGRLLNMNDRAHWAPKAKATREWREAAYYAGLQAFPGPPRSRLLPARRYALQCFLPVRGNRQRDPFNVAPTAKAICDGLAVDGRHGPGAGFFVDDSAEYVTVPEPVLVVGADVVRVEISPV